MNSQKEVIAYKRPLLVNRTAIVPYQLWELSIQLIVLTCYKASSIGDKLFQSKLVKINYIFKGHYNTLVRIAT